MKLTKEKFLESVATHQLTINLDQGVYRDITVAKPDDISMHYIIITRPGYLVITGDMGSFTLSCTNDMFGFFRSEGGYRINPGYWGEKAEAVDTRKGLKKFSSDKAKQSLKSWLGDFVRDIDVNSSDARENIVDATDAILSVDCSDVYAFVEAVRDFDPDIAGGLDLSDFDHAETDSYTYRYLWCCYAIVHAIKLYDEAKVEVAA